jgi:hypothetical protein
MNLKPGKIGPEDQTGNNTSKPMSKSGSKPKKQTFSIVKAVKANARARVGSPPPERVLPDPKQKLAAKPKHKPTLADLLDPSGEDR